MNKFMNKVTTILLYAAVSIFAYKMYNAVEREYDTHWRVEDSVAAYNKFRNELNYMDTYQQDSSKNNSLEKEYHLPNLLVELRASNEISVQDSINIEEAVKKEMSRIYSGLKRRE